MSRRFVYYGAGKAGISFLLDSYPAEVAYSLRKLRSNYNGSAIRVRRSSDNAEQDIGFDSNGNLDTVSLLNFVGNGNEGFVSTYYNQGSLGVFADLKSDILTNQPIIVVNSSGTPVLIPMGLNGYQINFSRSGIKHLLSDNSLSLLDDGSTFTMFANAEVINFNSNTIFSTESRNLRPRLAFLPGNTVDKRIIHVDNGSVIYESEANQRATPGFYVITGLVKGDIKEITSWSNGVVGGTNVWAGTYNNHRLQMGLDRDNDWKAFGVSELIIYASDQSLNRVAIENNINSYYGIY